VSPSEIATTRHASDGRTTSAAERWGRASVWLARQRVSKIAKTRGKVLSGFTVDLSNRVSIGILSESYIKFDYGIHVRSTRLSIEANGDLSSFGHLEKHSVYVFIYLGE
jgi:hypothetical protein